MHVYEWTTDSIVDDEQKRSNLVGSVLLRPADVEIFAPGYHSRSQNGERTHGTRQENRPHYIMKLVFTSYLDSFYCGFQTDYVASRLQLATGKQHDFQLYHSNFRKAACLWRFDWWQPQRSLPFGASRWEIPQNYENHTEINNSLVRHKFNWIPNILFLLPLSTVYCHYDRKNGRLKLCSFPEIIWLSSYTLIYIKNAQKSVKLNDSSFDNVFSLPCI